MCGPCNFDIMSQFVSPYHCVRQVGVAIKLILHQIVQHLKEEEHQLMVGLVCKQEPGRGECLNQVKQLAGGRHGEGLDVGRNVGKDGQQAFKQGLQPLVTSGDDLRNGHFESVQYL